MDVLCMSSFVLLRYHGAQRQFVHYQFRYRDRPQAAGALSGCFQRVAGEVPTRMWQESDNGELKIACRDIKAFGWRMSAGDEQLI